MAVPMTSCMSEPMMAISIMSQSSTRGTCGGRGHHVVPEPTVACSSGQAGTASYVQIPVSRL